MPINPDQKYILQRQNQNSPTKMTKGKTFPYKIKMGTALLTATILTKIVQATATILIKIFPTTAATSTKIVPTTATAILGIINTTTKIHTTAMAIPLGITQIPSMVTDSEAIIMVLKKDFMTEDHTVPYVVIIHIQQLKVVHTWLQMMATN